MLRALAGWHPRDRHSLDVDDLTAPAADPRTLRVVASEDLGFAPVDDDVRAAFRAVLARSRTAGAQVVEDTPGRRARRVAAWSTIATAEARYSEGVQFEHHHALLGEAAAEFMAHGGRVTREQYVTRGDGARADPPRLRRSLRSHGRLRAADPDAGLEAFRHGSAHPREVGGLPIEPPWLDWCGLLYDANLAGLPACAVPIGLGDDGLPVSLQVLGPRARDGAVLAAAEAIERLVAFSPRPPEPHSWSTPHVEDTLSRTRQSIRPCAGSPRSGSSSGRTRRRSTSSRRRRSTCSGSTAGCATSSTSPTSTRSRAATRAWWCRPTARIASSRRSRTSATTCCATARSSPGWRREGPGGKAVVRHVRRRD